MINNQSKFHPRQNDDLTRNNNVPKPNRKKNSSTNRQRRANNPTKTRRGRFKTCPINTCKPVQINKTTNPTETWSSQKAVYTASDKINHKNNPPSINRNSPLNNPNILLNTLTLLLIKAINPPNRSFSLIALNKLTFKNFLFNNLSNLNRINLKPISHLTKFFSEIGRRRL